MRADRLLSLLMLLQNRQKLTARELALELEVTERTIYRDIDALCAAGVPIVAASGPNGGYSLIEGYRSRLTGLTDAEIQALGALSVAAPLADLDLAKDIQSALLKLSASVSTERTASITRVRERVLVDADPWLPDGRAPSGLSVLYQAALEDRMVLVTFDGPNGMSIERTIGVLGLIAKEGVWHMVSMHRDRPWVQLVEDLVIVEHDTGPFDRPDAFDLGRFWSGYCRQRQRLSQSYAVQVSVSPTLMPHLSRMLGWTVPENEPRPSPKRPGWSDLTLTFPSFEHARGRLLACGGGLVVREPYQLAVALADVAAQIAALYAPDD